MKRTAMMNDNTVMNDNDDVEVADCQKVLDELDRIVGEHNFPIINRLDIRYRARIAKHIVWQNLSEIDREAVKSLANGRLEWHVFKAGNLPFDGRRDTVVSLQMGLLECANARPFGFLEGDGAVDRRVVPVKGKEDAFSTAGTRAFDAHIDHAWARFSWEPDDGRPVIPDFVTLGGYRNPNRVGTLFANRLEILSDLSELTRYVLEKPEWSFAAPPSVTPARIATNLPIVTRGPDMLPVIRLNPRIICETQRAVDALAELKEAMANPNLWTEIVLEPCDIVVARGTALHKRGEIVGERELTAVYGRHQDTPAKYLSEANRHLEPVCA